MANRRRRSIAHGKFCGSTGSHIRQGDWWVLDECKVGLKSFTEPRDQQLPLEPVCDEREEELHFVSNLVNRMSFG